jgi:putative transcriptional regulator
MIELHINDMRKAKDWTKKELGQRTEINENRIMSLCHSLAKSIKLDELEALCEVFNCQPGDLIEYKDPTRTDLSRQNNPRR